jgi:putative intracellular protease/amidase
VLAAASIAKAHRITCHASVVEQMREYWVLSDSVVRDGILITGAGAASSWEFSIAILEELVEPSTLLRVLEETMTIM